MYYPQQGSSGNRGLLNHYEPQRGLLNNNNQLITNQNLPPPATNAVPPVPTGSGIIPTETFLRYNPQNINNNP